MDTLGNRDDRRVWKAREMPAMQRRADMLRKLRQAKPTVRRLDANDLVPRGEHQVFLFCLHHARAQPCHDAMTRIEVQLTKPCRLCGKTRLFGLDPRLARMCAAIQRRSDERRGRIWRMRLLV